MTELVLRRSAPHVLLSHLALYGLGAILEAADVGGLRIGWTGGVNPRPVVHASSVDRNGIGEVVRDHAGRASAGDSWVMRDHAVNGSARGLMSPRLSAFGEDIGVWTAVRDARHDVLDRLTAEGDWLDLRFLAALGEPAYWNRNAQGAITQDDGASRLEMQPRNRGSEFVGSRLRKLAATVAAREPDTVAAGLVGALVCDEAGSDELDSRTATGLAAPGPTDNALAWCALWGISQFPVAMRVAAGPRNTPAVTTGNVRLGRRGEWFYVPMWSDPWRPARLRTVLAADPLRSLVAWAASGGEGVAVTQAEAMSSRTWLTARGVDGLMRFPVARFGSDNAPERRAMRGEPVPTGTAS